MKNKSNLTIKGIDIAFIQTHQEDFICITEIAKYKNLEAPRDIKKLDAK